MWKKLNSMRLGLGRVQYGEVSVAFGIQSENSFNKNNNNRSSRSKDDGYTTLRKNQNAVVVVYKYSNETCNKRAQFNSTRGRTLRFIFLICTSLCSPFFTYMNTYVWCAECVCIQNESLALHPSLVSCSNAIVYRAFLWYFPLWFFLFFFVQFLFFFAVIFLFSLLKCSIHLISSLVFLLLFSLRPSLFRESHK